MDKVRKDSKLHKPMLLTPDIKDDMDEIWRPMDNEEDKPDYTWSSIEEGWGEPYLNAERGYKNSKSAYGDTTVITADFRRHTMIEALLLRKVPD